MIQKFARASLSLSLSLNALSLSTPNDNEEERKGRGKVIATFRVSPPTGTWSHPIGEGWDGWIGLDGMGCGPTGWGEGSAIL